MFLVLLGYEAALSPLGINAAYYQGQPMAQMGALPTGPVNIEG